jgi:hypothetical protein
MEPYGMVTLTMPLHVRPYAVWYTLSSVCLTSWASLEVQWDLYLTVERQMRETASLLTTISLQSLFHHHKQ